MTVYMIGLLIFELPWLSSSAVGVVSYVAMTILNLFLDAHLSPQMGKTAKVLRANGFSDGGVLAAMFFNLVATVSLMGSIGWYLRQVEPAIFTLAFWWQQLAGAPWLLGCVAVDLACSELLFTLAHKWLHEDARLARLHLMHHCCLFPSWCTNLIFHPLDLALEFTGPIAFTLLLHFVAWKNAAVLAVSSTLIQVWYALDHDEYANLFHIAHHQHIDSLYSIYITIRGPPKANLLKNLVKRQ